LGMYPAAAAPLISRATEDERAPVEVGYYRFREQMLRLYVGFEATCRVRLRY
jgi:hypothetical protein